MTQDPGKGGRYGLEEVWKDYEVTPKAGLGIRKTNSHFPKLFLSLKWEHPLTISALCSRTLFASPFSSAVFLNRGKIRIWGVTIHCAGLPSAM